MNVVRHDDKFIDTYLFESLAKAQPFIFCQTTSLIQDYFPAGHITEQAFALIGYNGDEIHLRAGVIVIRQAGGAAGFHG
jgi:hypothetical protein